MTTLDWVWAHLVSHRLGDRPPRDRLTGDRGEGVISASIAVLIMAFLGALMWFGFQRMWQTTEQNTNDRVEQIGTNAP